MKKILALILAAGLMLCACGGEPATAKLSVDATSVTPTGLEYTLTIEGKGELENVGDGDYYIEKNSGGAWSRVNTVTQPVPTAVAQSITEGSIVVDLDWSAAYGELSGGLYKLYKTVTLDGESVTLSADFEIITEELE